MLRQILTCLASLALVPALDAANTGIHRADPARPFEPIVIVTKQPAYQDLYFHTLGDVGPEFVDVSSLWAGEHVYILVLAGNYAVSAASDVDLTFDLAIERPDGTKETGSSDLPIFQGKTDDPQTVPFPAKVPEFSTGPGDPVDDYILMVTVHDRIGHENRLIQKKLHVSAFKSAELTDNFSAEDWMMNYYRVPRPELALPALRAMVKKVLPANDDAWPPMIGFYDALLADNPWLVPVFAEGMHQGTENEIRSIARVLGYALRHASKPPAGVTSDDWTALAGARAEKWPDPDAPLTDPAQLDMLWGRFFATGAFEPVNRVASAVEYYPFLGRLDEIKKSGQKPAVMPPEAMKELVFRSALWSLGSIAKQQPLVHHYGEWILAREKLDASSQLLLAKALGHDVKVDSAK